MTTDTADRDQWLPDRSEFFVYATGADRMHIRHQPCKSDSGRHITVTATQLDAFIASHVCPTR